MASLLRSTAHLARASRSTLPTIIYRSARFQHSSYGNSQSGHQKSDAPMGDKEHPGPEAPADKGTNKSSATESSSSSTSSSTPEKSASNDQKDNKTSSGAKPALHVPNDAADTNDPEVKKHNEDMRKRADQTPNQVEGS